MFGYERGMTEITKSTRVLIVIPPLTNHLYFLYLWGIIRYLQSQNLPPLLVFNRGASDFNGHFLEVNRKTRANESKFISFLIAKGFSSELILYSDEMEFDFLVAHKELEACSTAGELLDINLDYPLLRLSLHSIFVSHVASADEDFPIINFISLLRRMQDNFHYSYSLCRELASKYKFDGVIFLNGRDPGQAGIRHFAEEMKITWHALEHGISPGQSFHLENFQTQDRLAIQCRMSEVFENISQQDLVAVEKWYLGWAAKQTSDRHFNPNMRAGRILPDWFSAESEYVAIFTTSLEEDISSVGYSRTDLKELILKTVSCARKIEESGKIPIIVVHPNSLNKSWNDLSLLYLSFSEASFKVIWPWQNISSYEVISISTYCVTWRSTIALEVLIGGKPCLNLAESTYDLFVGVPEFDLSTLNGFNFKELRNRALLHMFLWMNHGHKIGDYLPDSEYLNLKNRLHGKISASKYLGALRYYYSILSVSIRWKRATPKQVQRFMQLFGSESLVDFIFRKLLTVRN